MKKLTYLMIAGAFVFSVCGDNDPARIEAAGGTLSGSALSLRPGQHMTLTAHITPAGDKRVVRSSSDERAATVGNGVVNAVAPGKAIIHAGSMGGGKSASCNVSVEPVVGRIAPERTTLAPEPGDPDENTNPRYKHKVTPTRGFCMNPCEAACVRYAAFLYAAGVPEPTGQVSFYADGYGGQRLFYADGGDPHGVYRPADPSAGTDPQGAAIGEKRSARGQAYDSS